MYTALPLPVRSSLPPSHRPVARARRAVALGLGALLALAAGLPLFAGSAAAQAPNVQIGFCPGAGGTVTVTITIVVLCPAPTTLSATIMAPCDDAGAVMAAVDGAMGGFMIGGVPLFGPPVVVGGGVSGQTRHEYPLSPAFLFNTNCIIQSVDIDFDCGTMGLVVRIPGVPHSTDTPPGPTKLGVFSAPPGPDTLIVKFEGCPAISVPLDGTESATTARDKLLAALLAAGYDAHVGPDGRIVVDADCHGTFPDGTDEYGLAGGDPMHLGIGSCPPPDVTGTHGGTWGALKSIYR